MWVQRHGQPRRNAGARDRRATRRHPGGNDADRARRRAGIPGPAAVAGARFDAPLVPTPAPWWDADPRLPPVPARRALGAFHDRGERCSTTPWQNESTDQVDGRRQLPGVSRLTRRGPVVLRAPMVGEGLAAGAVEAAVTPPPGPAIRNRLPAGCRNRRDGRPSDGTGSPGTRAADRGGGVREAVATSGGSRRPSPPGRSGENACCLSSPSASTRRCPSCARACQRGH